jgi:glycosyltransferase involved in cell wall biosynthesis
MRVAYLCLDPGVPVFGTKGCSVHVQEILRAFVKRGDKVELFAVRLGGEVPKGLETVKVHELPLPRVSERAREEASLALNQVVVSLFESRFDLLYERYSLWSYAAMEFAEARRIPSLLEVNAPLIEEQAKHRGLHHREAAAMVAQRVFAAASAIVCVSEGVADYVRNQVQTRDKVHVVPNGVNLERFRQATPLLESREFTVGFVGTLKPWHGVETLLEAFALLKVSDKRLLLVGDGPERIKLEARASELGLIGQVLFTGAVSPDVVPNYLVSMDVAVAPYPRLENFYFSPLKLYEYMAAAVPVVASRIGQMTNVIQHDGNGLLYSPGDTEELAGLLEQLYHQPSLRQRLAKAARRDVAGYSWDKVLQKMLNLTEVGVSV